MIVLWLALDFPCAVAEDMVAIAIVLPLAGGGAVADIPGQQWLSL